MSRYIDQYRGRFGVEPICRTLDVSASAYYHRATGERSARTVEDERLLGRIRSCMRRITSPTGLAGCGKHSGWRASTSAAVTSSG